MINQYKRLDVFRCKLTSHESFAGRVSAYHVLKVKRCLPDGCFYFKWRCRLLEKGTACRKGYHYPGKNCTGCRFYWEEKIHKIPVVQLSADKYREFLDELERFEEWLAANKGRRLEVYGRVNFVGPLLAKTVYPGNSRVSLKGYLVNFAECYLGRTHFQDYVYLRLSRSAQQRLRLQRGDLVEFEAELTVDEGRLVLEKAGKLEFRECTPRLREEDLASAIVEARTATVLDTQSERCLNCERGRLVDVLEKGTGNGRGFYRQLFCLESVTDPSICCYQALKALRLKEGYVEP